MSQKGRLIKTLALLRRSGLGYLWHLLTGVLVLRANSHLLHGIGVTRLRRYLWFGFLGTVAFVLALLNLLWGLLTATLILVALSALALLLRMGAKRVELSHLQRKARELTQEAKATYGEDTFTSWPEWLVCDPVRQAVEAARGLDLHGEIVIGRIDNDGRVLGLFGELPGLENITEADFVERYRYPVDIVLVENKVLIRKNFGGDRVSFLREWYNLAFLYRKANVPAIYRVDEHRCWLYKSLIPGRTIRAILADAGARILNVQTENDPELAELDQASRIQAVWERGRALIPSCFSKEFLCELENQLDRIHACGAAGLSLTYGNIIVDSISGEPWFIDFDGARAFRSTSSFIFAYRRNQDRDKFSRLYGRNLVTEKPVRAT